MLHFDFNMLILLCKTASSPLILRIIFTTFRIFILFYFSHVSCILCYEDNDYSSMILSTIFLNTTPTINLSLAKISYHYQVPFSNSIEKVISSSLSSPLGAGRPFPHILLYEYTLSRLDQSDCSTAIKLSSFW